LRHLRFFDWRPLMINEMARQSKTVSSIIN
jgi:hypothetical protein